MLTESLAESLESAKFCIEYKKNDKSKWGKFATGGCLGYPGAILLFSIVDSIGSYFRKDASFKIQIDGKPTSIKSDGWEHFKILNSDYFGQNLPEEFIKKLYSKFRSFLTHNHVLGKETYLMPSNELNLPFLKQKNQKGDEIYFVSLKELCELCDKAVIKFLAKIDEIVPNSRQGKDFK